MKGHAVRKAVSWIVAILFTCYAVDGVSQPSHEQQLQALNQALIAAVKVQDVPRVKLLLKQGADANAFESVYQPPPDHKLSGMPSGIDRRRTALLLAVNGGEPIRHLISPNGAAYLSSTRGLQRGGFGAEHLMIVKSLVARGADVNAPGYMGRTALMWTIRDGYYKVAEFLLGHGADPNVRDDNGDTALFLVPAGLPSILRKLVEASADVNVKGPMGRTVLAQWVHDGDFKSVAFLLNHGADVAIRDDAGDTALTLAEDNPKMLALLNRHRR